MTLSNAARLIVCKAPTTSSVRAQRRTKSIRMLRTVRLMDVTIEAAVCQYTISYYLFCSAENSFRATSRPSLFFFILRPRFSSWLDSSLLLCVQVSDKGEQGWIGGGGNLLNMFGSNDSHKRGKKNPGTTNAWKLTRTFDGAWKSSDSANQTFLIGQIDCIQRDPLRHLC